MYDGAVACQISLFCSAPVGYMIMSHRSLADMSCSRAKWLKPGSSCLLGT